MIAKVLFIVGLIALGYYLIGLFITGVYLIIDMRVPARKDDDDFITEYGRLKFFLLVMPMTWPFALLGYIEGLLKHF